MSDEKLIFIQDKVHVLNSARTYTAQGYLEVECRIAKTGVQAYSGHELGLEDNQIYHILRDEGDVFDQSSMDTFSNKPITLNHPEQQVDTSNFMGLTVGISGHEVVRDGDYISTKLLIMDENAIASIEAGKNELSNGYQTDIEWTPGVHSNGLKYDGRQTNIRGNHIAIVDNARAGGGCHIADNNEVDLMEKVTINGVEFEVNSAGAQAIKKLIEEHTQMKADAVHAESEEKDKMKADNDVMKAKLDDALTKVPTSAQIDKLVSDRLQVIDSAKQLMPDLVTDGVSNDDIIKQTVISKLPDLTISDHSMDYIRARFDALQVPLLDAALVASVTSSSDQTTDTKSLDVISRDAFCLNTRNAWKNSTNKGSV